MNIFKVKAVLENTIAITGLGGLLLLIISGPILGLQTLLLNLAGLGAHIPEIVYTSVIQRANLAFPWTLPLLIIMTLGLISLVFSILLMELVLPKVYKLWREELDK